MPWWRLEFIWAVWYTRTSGEKNVCVVVLEDAEETIEELRGRLLEAVRKKVGSDLANIWNPRIVDCLVHDFHY